MIPSLLLYSINSLGLLFLELSNGKALGGGFAVVEILSGLQDRGPILEESVRDLLTMAVCNEIY